MPRIYRKRKFIKKRKGRKVKRTYRKKTAAVQRTQVNLGRGMPKQIKMTHRYCDTVRLVSSSGVPAFYRFRANGIYDPDQTGVGHQPIGSDEMKLLYNHWKVIGSKITVQFIPTASTTIPQHIGIQRDDDTSSALVLSTLQEQTNTRKSAIAWANSSPRTLVATYSARKTYGGSIMGNNRLEGDAGNDPTEQHYYTLYNGPVEPNGTTACGVDAIVTIDYIVIWTEAKDLVAS